MKKLILIIGMILACAQMAIAQVDRIPGPGGASGVTPLQFTLLFKATNSACGSVTNCAVTLPQSIPNGALMVISVTKNGDRITGIDRGGTFVECFACLFGPTTNGNYASGGYVFPTVSAASPLTVNTTGASVAQIDVRVYTLSTGFAVVDTFNGAVVTSPGTPYNGQALTLTGTNDVIVQTSDPANHITSVASPYNTNSNIVNGDTGAGFADRLNTNSGTAPSWTPSAAPTNAANQGLAFAAISSACNDVTIFDSSNGTNGNTPGSTDVKNSTHGINSGFAIGITNGSSLLKYATAAHQAFINAPGVLCSGPATAYSDSGSVGLQWTSTSANTGFLEFDFNAAQSPNPGDYPVLADPVTTSTWFSTDFAQTDTGVNIDMMSIGSAGDFINALLFGDTTHLFIKPEGASASCNGVSVQIASSTLYKIVEEYRNTGNATDNNIVRVYASDGVTQVGSDMTCHPVAGTHNPVKILWGPNNIVGTPTTGRHVNLDKLQICASQTGASACAFPQAP